MSYPFTWDEKSQRMMIFDLPSVPPDPKCTVIKVEFEAEPQCGEEIDKSAWLNL